VLHLENFKGSRNREQLVKQATGRYYTGELVGRRLALETAAAYYGGQPTGQVIRVLDPFGGDGRLVEWLIEAWYQSGFPDVQWDVAVWDLDSVGFDAARSRFKRLIKAYRAKCRIRFSTLDTFLEASRKRSSFDIVITNPPWELLKPDRRELASLNSTRKTQYISRLRAYDRWLSEHYPLSQPRRKFAGWGTNLSRVGLEAGLSLVKQGGMMGVVLPASILADDQTVSLREHLLTHHSLMSATHYPAEAKLYGSADVASIALTLSAGTAPAPSLAVTAYDVRADRFTQSTMSLDYEVLKRFGYTVPVSFDPSVLKITQDLTQRFPSWLDLESAPGGLWAGREIDETGIHQWLCPPSGKAPLFVKGRMIDRYSTPAHLLQSSVKKSGWSKPASTDARRIAWRDVSRPSQRRRMIATLIEPGCVAGNSIGVAYFRDMAETPLLSLLGIMNSTCFELQLRAHLATGHVSLSSLRKVAVPGADQLRQSSLLANLVKEALHACDSDAVKVDAYVACRIYGLTEEEYLSVLGSFHGFSDDERRNYLNHYRHWASTDLPRSTLAPRKVTQRACATT
jgi:Alw26I/Eco31I/Esp3I family type II restriction m6 adenine DNA methyltransferase